MNCTIWATAYILGVSSEILIKELGHKGDEILWPEFQDERRYRGFCLAEVQDLLFKRGKLLAPIFVSPVIMPAMGCQPYVMYPEAQAERRLEVFLAGHIALLMGRVTGGTYHAIIYDNGFVDPRRGATEAQPPADYQLQEAYIVCKLI